MKKICIAGDVTIDWFHYTESANTKGASQSGLPTLLSQANPGGAYLTAEFLKLSLEAHKNTSRP